MDDFLRNLSADPLGETLLLVPSPYTSVAFTTIFLQQRRIIVREYWMMQQLTTIMSFSRHVTRERSRREFNSRR